jgi:hypothetical protein
MSNQTSHRWQAFTLRRAALALLLPLLAAASLVQAQDAIRPSLAGEASAEARRQSLDRIPYNLLVGPVRFRVSATAGLEYNDNINIAQVDRLEDVIFRPQLNLNVFYPITQLNTFRFDLGLGYAFYLDHSQYNTNALLLAPGSQLSFDIFIGDFRINLHNRMSHEQDPIGEPGLSGVVDYGRFQNTAGVMVLWDLNAAVLTVGYDHYTFIATNDDFDYLDRQAHMFTGSLGFTITDGFGVGVESGYVLNNYDRDVLNDSNTFHAGAYLDAQISTNMRVRVAGGYQHIDFDAAEVRLGPFPPGFLPGGQTFLVFNDDGSLNDFYLNAVLSHRINGAFTHRISAGYESQLGVNSNFIRLGYVRHTATWNIINRTLLTTEFFYEDAEDSGGFIDEHLQRYGGALSLGYQLTRHLTLGARYQHTRKHSDVPFRDYRQNRVMIDGTYSF